MRRKILANNQRIVVERNISEYEAMELFEAGVESKASAEELEVLYVELDSKLSRYNDVFAEFVINTINHKIRVGDIKIDDDVIAAVDMAMRKLDNSVLGRLVLDGRTVKRIANRASYWMKNWLNK